MRQKLANTKPAALQQCRKRWQKREEKVQRFQDKKEEAWPLFRRQGGLSRKTRDDFEREFKHQVMRSLDCNSKEDEKSLEKWTDELRAKGRGGRDPEDEAGGRPLSKASQRWSLSRRTL